MKLKSRRHQRCPQWLRSRERHLLGKRRELLGLIGQYRKLVLCIAMMGFTAFADDSWLVGKFNSADDVQAPTN